MTCNTTVKKQKKKNNKPNSVIEEGKEMLVKLRLHSWISSRYRISTPWTYHTLPVVVCLLTDEKHRNSSHWARSSQSQQRPEQWVSMVTGCRLGRGSLGKSENLKVKARNRLCAHTDPLPLGPPASSFGFTLSFRQRKHICAWLQDR